MIALRREPLAPSNNLSLVDSSIISSAPDFANCAGLSSSSRETISKDFNYIKDRKAGKRRKKMNGKTDLVNGLVLSSISLDSIMVMGDSDAEMDGMSELEGEEIETGAEQPAGQTYAGGKEHGGAVWQEAAIGVVGDQEAGGARAIQSSTVQKLAHSGDR